MQQLKTIFRGIIARQLEQRVQRLIKDKKLKVVAVTGSYGKTSTKLAVASVLRQKYKVLAHEGNYNSEIGLPLSIFEMDVPDTLVNPLSWFKILDRIDKKLKTKYPYDVLVLEMGADQPGDIKKFMRYIRPDVGIVTAIAPVHLEGFGSIEAIADEKMALARGSKAILLNAEEERVMEEANNLMVPVQTYGVGVGEVRFSNIQRSKQLTLNGKLLLHNGEVVVRTHMLGRHSLAALAAAGAVGEELGLTADQVRDGIMAVEPFQGRMRALEGKGGTIIIDDTYNASPASVAAALQVLSDLPGRHIAILGNMNELGEVSASAHREIGAAASGSDLLITIGAEAGRFMVEGAIRAGMSKDKIHTCTSPYAAGQLVVALLKKGDVVLAKGSQNGVFAEEAIAPLLANPADRTKLVRQSDDWQARKRAQFADAPSA